MEATGVVVATVDGLARNGWNGESRGFVWHLLYSTATQNGRNGMVGGRAGGPLMAKNRLKERSFLVVAQRSWAAQ